jgi:hypothetical protein
MSKTIAFNIATQDGPRAEQGQVVRLPVGARAHRFVIHGDNLSDYRSGMRVGSIQGVKIERMARLSTYHRTSDREAAALTLAHIVDRVGLEKVEAQLAKFPTLNA